MDPHTGDVLAMANWPGFDPSDLGTPSRRSSRTAPPASPTSRARPSRPSPSPPPSRRAWSRPSTELPPALDDPGRRPRDRGGARAAADDPTVAEILAQSSNVGAVTIGLEVGAESFDEWIREFGFGEPTGVDFPGEEQGIVPTLDEYSGSTMGNLPIGQGLSVTPMQMAAGYAAIANGGILREPRLIAQVGGERVDADTERQRVISAQTAAQLRTMLEGVLAPGRHRLRGERARLRARRQDGNRREGRGRRLLGDRLRRLVRRLRPGRRTRAAGRRGGRRAAYGAHRRRGRGAGLRRDRRVRPALPGHRRPEG